MAFPKAKPNRLPLFTQALALRRAFPASTTTLNRGELRWTGELTPTELSPPYRLRMQYRPGSNPTVRLIHPSLRCRGGERPPHLYSFERAELCLFRPGKGEWRPDLLLVDTMVPWAAEWLLHYEFWLATGEWFGGGEHPGERSA